MLWLVVRTQVFHMVVEVWSLVVGRHHETPLVVTSLVLVIIVECHCRKFCRYVFVEFSECPHSILQLLRIIVPVVKFLAFPYQDTNGSEIEIKHGILVRDTQISVAFLEVLAKWIQKLIFFY